MIRRWLVPSILVLATLQAASALAYPVDAFSRTGIRRLKWQYVRDFGAERRGWHNTPGGKWLYKDIELRMTSAAARSYDLDESTAKDPQLQRQLEDILERGGFDNYEIALLDITIPERPRFAGVGETNRQTPGSVAKVLTAAALFNEIAKRFPEVSDRERFLRSTLVAADEWAMPDHHGVLVEGSDGKFTYRPIAIGDEFSLWEWLDHMLSRSSSAAASTVWREATLMHLLGDSYPPTKWGPGLWRRWSKAQWTNAAYSVIDAPLEQARIPVRDFMLRRFFTGGAKRFVERKVSRSTPLAMVQWMLSLEQGRIVDEFSSLELKRLLYVTIERIRYASAPELKDAAVYSKSGSLYQCRRERGYQCAKYRGNALNILNTIATVEAPNTTVRPVVYIVAVMSNQLRHNASKDHARLAGEIHKLMLETRR